MSQQDEEIYLFALKGNVQLMPITFKGKKRLAMPFTRSHLDAARLADFIDTIGPGYKRPSPFRVGSLPGETFDMHKQEAKKHDATIAICPIEWNTKNEPTNWGILELYEGTLRNKTKK